MSLLSGRARSHRSTLAGALVAGSLLITACGSSSAATKDAFSMSPTTTPAGAAVTIDTFMFSPATVHVHVGDTVTWTNKDSILHTVTTGNREYEPGNSGHVTATHKDGMVDMQLDGKGATASHTFSTPGAFHYFCDRHPGMEAEIEVS